MAPSWSQESEDRGQNANRRSLAIEANFEAAGLLHVALFLVYNHVFRCGCGDTLCASLCSRPGEAVCADKHRDRAK